MWQLRAVSLSNFSGIVVSISQIRLLVPEPEIVCDGDSPELDAGGAQSGYSAKSILPAIIGSMKEDALLNIF